MTRRLRRDDAVRDPSLRSQPVVRATDMMSPTIMKVATMDEPPAEMNGRGRPRQRQDAQHTAHVDERLHQDAAHQAARQQLAGAVGCLARDAQARPSQQDEQQHDEHGAEQPQLLADDREDEVVLGLGQIRVLLAGVTQAHAEKAPRGKGVQAVADLQGVAVIDVWV